MDLLIELREDEFLKINHLECFSLIWGLALTTWLLQFNKSNKTVELFNVNKNNNHLKIY